MAIFETKLLGELCSFTQGVQIADKDTVKAPQDGYIRYIYIRDLFTDKFPVYVKNEYPNKILKPNDIVMVNTGNTSGYVYKAKEGVLCNNAFKISVKANKKNTLDNGYLWVYLNSDARERMLKRLFNPAGQPHVGHKNVARLAINIPPLSEQRKIAKILSTWDKAIATTERLIAASQQQKKALMQQLLTGKKRLVNPDTGKVFEGDWENVNLSSLAKSGKKNFTDGDWIESPYITDSGCRLIQTGNIGIGCFKDKNKKYISSDSFDELGCTEVLPGDLLICRLAEPAGRACVVPDLNEDRLLTSVDVTIMKVDNKKSSALFLSYYFSLDHTLYTISALCGGSTRSRVSRTNLAKIKILQPPLTEQRKITAVLTAADKEIELLEAKLAHLKDEKNALMQQLLTGKRRVKINQSHNKEVEE